MYNKEKKNNKRPNECADEYGSPLEQDEKKIISGGRHIILSLVALTELPDKHPLI